MHKVIWYFNNIDNIKFIRKEFPELINEKADIRLIDYITFDLETPLSVLDRTETTEHFLKMKNISPMPEYDISFNKSYEEICMERAKYFIDTNKHITLCWSGGIDSTTALAAFLKCGIKKDQLTVIGNMKSLKEHPRFFKNYITKLDRFFCIENPMYHIKNDGGLVITGEHNDQIFGSIITIDLFKKGLLKFEDPYEKHINGKFLELMKPIMNKCPFKLETIQDFYWWLSFCLKWQDVKVRIVNYFSNPRIIENTHTFFESTDFQQWSLNNNDKKIGRDLESYKMTAKEFIFEFDKDYDYLKYKTKIGSLKMNRQKEISFMNEKFETVRI